jgi:two-component system, NtrC family, sensor histidine kinase PilS
VQSINSGLLMVDNEARILYLNRRGEDLLGRTSGEVRGRSLREVFGSHLFDGAALAARAADEKLSRFEATYLRAGEGAVDLGCSVMPLLGPGPRSGAYLLVFEDLTDLKRLEREVRANEKLAAVGEMAAQLAHEIRNPLGAISGSAQVLMGESNMTEEQGRLLGIITRESRRLSEALNQFLYQTRPNPGGIGPVDLGPLLEEAVSLLVNGPEVSPQHELKFERDRGPHVCLADPDQMLQVFWNLARNGLEAMPEGGRLLIRLRRHGDQVVLTVSDQGRGFGKDGAGRAFEPLRSGSRMGGGLGLAIVYRIVRDHKGDISTRSIPGQGTEVEVCFPLVRSVAVAQGEKLG